jgi:hypothetical protein
MAWPDPGLRRLNLLMPRALRPLSWAAVAVPFVLLLCHEWFGPDIWYHLYLGRRVSQTFLAQPPETLILWQPSFINFYWLFQAAVWGAFAVGRLDAVSLLFIVVWAIALAVALRTAGAGRAGAWGPWFALWALLVCQTRFEQRPEIFSYAFLALQIRWLLAWPRNRVPSAKEFVRFALVQAVWSNMHGYFAFGPLLVGLRLLSLGAEWHGPDWPRHRAGRTGLAQLLGLTLLASVASPFGWHNWEEIAVLWHFLGAMRLQIQEFIPPSGLPLQWWTVKIFWAYWAATLAAATFVLGTAARKELFAVLLAGVGLYLSATAYRNIPLIVFFGAPVTGAAFSRIARWQPPEIPARLAAIAAALALAAWVVSNGFYRSIASSSAFGIRESEYAYPIFFSDYLQTTGFAGSIFDRAADGGYLEFHFPQVRFYGDSRFTDPTLVDEYFKAVTQPAFFRELQRRHAFDAALLSVAESRAVITDLLGDPDWTMAYADLHRVFLVNRTSAAGRALPLRAPQFYRGEDLTIPFNGLSAVRWIDVLEQVGDRRDLLLDLQQLGRAPRIPSLLLQAALHDGEGSPDPEIVAAVQAMRPRMVASRPLDAEFVAWLFRRSPP